MVCQKTVCLFCPILCRSPFRDTDIPVTGKRFCEHEDRGSIFSTVSGIRCRFVEEGLQSALERKKQTVPSRKLKFDGEREAGLIAMSCGAPPEGYARWNLRLPADKPAELEISDSVSYETVRQTLKKTD